MTASSSLVAGRVPAAHAAADLTSTLWKSTTLTPTPGARLRRCQTSAQTWPPSRTEARYTSLVDAAVRASRRRSISTTRRRTPGPLERCLCRPHAPVLSQATRATRYTPLAEQMGFGTECERGVRHPQRLLVQRVNDSAPAGGWCQFPRRQDIRCRRRHAYIWHFDQCQRGVQALSHRETWVTRPRLLEAAGLKAASD